MAKVKNKRNAGMADKVHKKKKADINKKKLNPFEVHINREKIKVLGKKSKHDRGLPGVSRAKAYQKRKETLGTEMKLMNKTNAFIDKRIGEKNANLSAEDRMIARFAAERARQHTKKNIYNLADDEVLTHRGQTLEQIEKFDDPRSSDEEDEDAKKFGGLNDEFVSEGHFGGGMLSKVEKDGAKSHKDLIEQLIAESKKRKAERQKEKEQTLDLTEKLDSEWKDLQPVVFKRARVEEEKEKESIIDKLLREREKQSEDYDKMMRELKFDRRGTPSDALKSDEKKEREEKLRLEQLERERMQRMMGEIDTAKVQQPAAKHRSADDLDDNFALDDDKDIMLAYDKDGKPLLPEHILKDYSVPNAKPKFEDGISDTSSDEENGSEEDGEETDDGSDDSDENTNAKVETEKDVEKEESDEDEDKEAGSSEENLEKLQKKTKTTTKSKMKELRKNDESDSECDSESDVNIKTSNTIKKSDDSSDEEKSAAIEMKHNKTVIDSKIELPIEEGKNSPAKPKVKEKNLEITKNKNEDPILLENGDEEDDESSNGESDDENEENRSEEIDGDEKDDLADLRSDEESDEEVDEDDEGKLTSYFDLKASDGENLKELLSGKTPTQQANAIQKLIKKYDPSLAENNKDKLSIIFAQMLQYVHDLFSGVENEGELLKSFLIFEKLAPVFYDLAHTNKVSSKKFITELLKEKHDYFMKHPRRIPDLDTLIYFKLVSLLYPTSDFRHPVTTPSLIFMSEILARARFNNVHAISRGLFLTSLVLEYTVLSKRLVPTAINFLRGILYLAANTSVLNPIQVVPPFKLHRDAKILNLEEDCSAMEVDSKMSVKDFVSKTIDNDFKIRCLFVTVLQLKEFFDYFNDIEAQQYLFEPHLQLFGRIDLELYPKKVSRCISKIIKDMKETLEMKTFTPLCPEKKKPKALRLYEPDIQEVFTGSKSAKLPREKAERSRLQSKIKKEMKGALREIRRDKAYIASVKIRQKIQSDNIRKEKVKQIYKEAAIQQGELNKLKRMK